MGICRRAFPIFLKDVVAVGKIILVTGGARSGKSGFAEKYAEKLGKNIAYIATSQIFDEEMRYRIDLHRNRRPSEWNTIEAPFEAEKAIEKAGESCDLILFDCLTIYISNLLCKNFDENNNGNLTSYEQSQKDYAMLKGEIEKLVRAAKDFQGTVIFVTNEVGAGIVPETAIGREYRDLAGLANQQVAGAADEVWLSVSGIPIELKSLQGRMNNV